MRTLHRKTFRTLVLMLAFAIYPGRAVQAADTSPAWSPAPAPLLERVADRVLKDFPQPPPFDWGEGVLMAGMMKAGVALKKPEYIRFVQTWAEHWRATGITGLLQERNYCGHWGPAFPLLLLYEHSGNTNYLSMAQQVVEFMETKAFRTRDGFPCHIQNDRQIWLDTLYMCCPVYTHFARAQADPKWNTHAAKLLELCARHCQETNTGLFWHVYDETKDTHIGPLWARGNGWVALSYVGVLAALDRSAPQYEPVRGQFEKLVRGILATRDRQSGLWHTILDRPDTYLETSASAMFLGAMVRGQRLGIIRVEQEVLARTWASLAAKVNAGGQVFDVSAGTDARTDLSRYINKPRGVFTWGTGAFLLAATELEAR
jgi:unsaturated rhamnogalacturonyl hydrolase